MVRSIQADLSPGTGQGAGKGGRFHPVRDHPPFPGVRQAAFDDNVLRSVACNSASAGAEKIAQADDLRFPGGIVDHGPAFGAQSGHQKILRGTHAGVRQADLSAGEGA